MSHNKDDNSEEDERLRTLFTKLDRNNDGRIDFEELLAELLSRNSRSATAQEFLKHDMDKDGKINYAEFCDYVEAHEKKLKAHFRKIDVNVDGIIDAVEIRKSFKAHGMDINLSEAEALVRRIDKDGTSQIDWEEWRDFYLLKVAPSSSMYDILHYWRHSTIIDIGDSTIVPDDFTETEMQTGMWWRNLMSGGAAGAVSRTSTAPLDRLKILLQVHGSKKNNLTIWKAFRQLLTEGGYRGLWRGNGINVIKIAPETALKFMMYEHIKSLFRGESKSELSAAERFMSGSMAGVISQTLIYPMEVMKTRLALGRTGQYNGIVDCAYKVFKNEGPATFYRGYLPNIIGIIPYAGIDLAIYETLKKFYMKRYADQDPSVFVLLACGTTSSTCGQLASYPLALIRTRLQAIKGDKISMTKMVMKIKREDGLRGFYRGLIPNFLKVAPAVSISYVVYENVRKQLCAKHS